MHQTKKTGLEQSSPHTPSRCRRCLGEMSNATAEAVVEVVGEDVDVWTPTLNDLTLKLTACMLGTAALLLVLLVVYAKPKEKTSPAEVML